MTKEELDKVLAAHKEWADGKGGQRADLQRADLQGAYLQGADLRDAYLQGAYLQGADLRNAHLQGADLRNAHLQGADLRGADLRGADLRDAYLQGADLRNAVHAWAQVAFMGHGECGRMLTAVIYEEGQEVTYQCGCFYGSAEELLKYINDGEERLKASRMLAFETAAKLIAQ